MDNLINTGLKHLEKNLNRGVDVKIEVGRIPHGHRPTPQPNHRPHNLQPHTSRPSPAPHRPAPHTSPVQARNNFDFDFELRTCWFTHRPVDFPSTMTNAYWDGEASLIRHVETSGFKTIHALIAAVRNSKTLVSLTFLEAE